MEDWERRSMTRSCCGSMRCRARARSASVACGSHRGPRIVLAGFRERVRRCLMPLMSAGCQVFVTRMTMSRSRYVRWKSCTAISRNRSGSVVVSGKAVVCRRHTWLSVIFSLPVLSCSYWPFESVQGWTVRAWEKGSAFFASPVVGGVESRACIIWTNCV